MILKHSGRGPEAPQGILPDEASERRLVTPKGTAFADSDTAYHAYEDKMRDRAEIAFNHEQDHPSIFGFGEIEVLRRELHHDIGQMEIRLRTIFA